VLNGEDVYKSTEILANPEACISNDAGIAEFRNVFNGKITA
jgi:hypothetical protein